MPEAGPTTIRVASVPLLSGGGVSAGGSVPVSYLQIANVGKNTAAIEGFRVKQSGSATESVVSEFNVLDDKGILQGSVRAGVGGSLFDGGEARIPAKVSVAPGTVRVFTIRALVGSTKSTDFGTRLTIDVTSLDAAKSTEVRGLFPIYGTTWVIR
jgi:hypothetical protein